MVISSIINCFQNKIKYSLIHYIQVHINNKLKKITIFVFYINTKYIMHAIFLINLFIEYLQYKQHWVLTYYYQ